MNSIWNKYKNKLFTVRRTREVSRDTYTNTIDLYFLRWFWVRQLHWYSTPKVDTLKVWQEHLRNRPYYKIPIHLKPNQSIKVNIKIY